MGETRAAPDPAPSKRRCSIARWAAVALLPMLLSGCAALVVRLENPRRALAREVAGARAEGGEAGRLAETVARAVPGEEARLVGVAQAALPAAASGDAAMRRVYSSAVAKLVEALEERGFRALDFPPGPVRRLEVAKRGGIDPTSADELVPAHLVRIGRLDTRATVEGLGVAYAAHFKRGSPALAGQPGVPPMGMALPFTAVLTVRHRVATLEFVPTLDRTAVTIRGRAVPLAADYSAPLALVIARGANRALDLPSMIMTSKNIGRAGLFQLQPYDPGRIPVVFVHGLMSRPEAWTWAVNALLADPVVRKNYQFWVFIYPTGLPIWTSASILRSELDRYNRALTPIGRNPNLNRKILVGHSMGGVIVNLMLRDGGEHLWGQFSDVPLAQAMRQPAFGRALKQKVDFRRRDDVARVIFVATPHRGSPMALRPISSLGAALIRLPDVLDHEARRILLDLIHDDQRSLFIAPANSIRFLRANSPLLLSILKLPRDRKIPMHSIIGDRGRPGPVDRSSDGIVPYWSSHLAEAASEKIVPSNHGVNEHPGGAAEIARILRLHLAETPPRKPRP